MLVGMFEHRPATLFSLLFPAFFAGCLLNGGPLDSSGSGGDPAGSGATTASGGNNGGHGGSGGSSGGATTTTSGSSGSGGGTSGAGGTMETTSTAMGCTEDAECPDDPSPCLDPKCDKMSSTCTTKNASDGTACQDPPGTIDSCHVGECKTGACELVTLANGTLVSTEPAGDCKKYVCENGIVVPKADDGDKPAALGCLTGACKMGEPEGQPEGSTCDVGTGSCCQGQCCHIGAQECGTAGCCFAGKTCGSVCCAVAETCCGGQCCVVCAGGNCVF